MPEAATYFDAIDAARFQRAKELSEIKSKLGDTTAVDPLAIGSKAAVVLAYANWEGFYNDCVSAYLDFLVECDLKIVETGWMMLVGALAADFESLRSRNSSTESKISFVEKMHSRMDCKFDVFDRSVVMARSNLNFAKINSNFSILGFDASPLLPFRLRIDKEVVGWRHGVAHGSAPDLNSLNIAAHLDFVGGLLLAISDTFQSAILQRLPAQQAGV